MEWIGADQEGEIGMNVQRASNDIGRRRKLGMDPLIIIIMCIFSGSLAYLQAPWSSIIVGITPCIA
jgi:hypothetical protein